MSDTGKIIALAKAVSGSIDPAVVESAVSDWLDDHPEATTTVEDGSITKAKLDEDLQETVDDVSDLKSALQGKYEKPQTGIPSSDMTSAVQTSLGLANSAYQKPANGIPSEDIASGVIPTVHNVPSGGASGKILKKASGTDFDLMWGDAPTATDAQVTTAVDTYLAANFTNPSNPPLDRSLASSSSAAPADIVGGLNSRMSVTLNIADSTEHFYIKSDGDHSDSARWYAYVINDLDGISYVDGAFGIGSTSGYLGIAFYNSETQDKNTFISGVAITNGTLIGAAVPSGAKSCAFSTRLENYQNSFARYYCDVSTIPGSKKTTDFINEIKTELIDTVSDVTSTDNIYIYYSDHSIEHNSSNILSYVFVNKGYKKIECKAASNSDQLSIISFFTDSITQGNYISGIQSASGIKEYSANVPSNCKLIVVSNRTASLAVPEVTLYNKIDTAIKDLNERTGTVEEYLMMNELSLSMGRYNSQNVGIVSDDYSMATQKMDISGDKTLVYMSGDYDVRVYFFADLFSNSISYTSKLPQSGLRIVNNPSGANFYSVVVYNPADSTTDLTSDQIAEIEGNLLVGQLNDFMELVKQYVYPNYNSSTIVQFNDDRSQLLEQLIRRRNTTGGQAASTSSKVLTLLHFSDIHGDGTNLQRIMDYYNAKKKYIDDVICTGDIVYQKYTDGITFWSGVDGTNKILICLGNHDQTDKSVDAYGVELNQAGAYAMYFTGISNWGATYTADLTYWYKDYDDSKIRLIGLNTNNLSAEEKTAQLTWLASTLASAKTAGLSVVIAAHYPLNGKVASNFTSIDNEMGNHYIPSDIQSTVDDFMDGGGEFICYLSGHTHCDYVTRNSNYPDQLNISITTSKNESGYYGDQNRVLGDRSQDAFNLVGFDVDSKMIKIIRIGANSDNYLRGRNIITIRYDTGNIVYQS